jgi:myo-inositol-1(or 4)-monophosphatase
MTNPNDPEVTKKNTKFPDPLTESQEILEIQHIKNVMLSAAHKAGTILLEKMGKISVSKKGRIDLVTEADQTAEAEIKQTILNHFPAHTIIAEETKTKTGDSDYSWIIDPLDGTTNYVHGLPMFAVSIAIAFREKVIAGVVFNPVTKELFCAEKNCGATLNGQQIKVSTTKTIADSLLATGFAYDLRELFDELVNRFSTCLFEARGIRRYGSAALDLCYLACGRYDGYWEQQLQPWDTAAGLIIASEAGAVITDFSGKSFNPFLKQILATNGLIHDEMLGLLNRDNPTKTRKI